MLSFSALSECYQLSLEEIPWHIDRATHTKAFYLSLHSVLLFIILFLFLGGKHCRWRPKHPEGDGEISGVKEEREESERDVNNRSERRTRKWERVKRRE